MRYALAVLVLLAGVARANPNSDLDRAREAFRAKNWQSAAEITNNLLYPTVTLGDRTEAVEGHLLLGAAKYEIGDRDRARTEFTEALKLNADASMSTNFSEGAVRLFEDTKAEFAAQRAREAEAKRLAEAREKLEAYRKSLVVIEKRSYGVNFVPFGAGQFQNKQNIKGFIFAGTEFATAATSAGIFLYLAGKYGLSAKVPLADSNQIRRLQQVEIGTSIAFFAIYAYGVFDSLRHYTPSVKVQGDDSLLPPELRDIGDSPGLAPGPTKPKPAPPKTSLHIVPMLVPDGAGVGLTLENF